MLHMQRKCAISTDLTLAFDGPDLPSHYCSYCHCHCPPTKCHNMLFDKYIQIPIVSAEVMESDSMADQIVPLTCMGKN
jgi:hypothetical protein